MAMASSPYVEESGEGFESILFAARQKPLVNWDCQVRTGHLKRISRDKVLRDSALELCGPNMNATYITCPNDPADSLGITLPCVVFVVKNMSKPVIIEAQVVDGKGVRRRFRASTIQYTTRVKPFITAMPLKLTPGWNRCIINLAEYTANAYGTKFKEVVRVQIHANCRVRHVYFCKAGFKRSTLPKHLKARKARSRSRRDSEEDT